MPFHRFIDPTYFEAVPLPGSINLNAYDRVNVISGGVGAGGSSPADSAKVGGPTPGTYFVAFGEDGTSLDANRGFRALAENADLLDDLLHRDLAVPKISAQFPNVAGTASFTIVDNAVFVGNAGTPATDAGRGGLIGLVDDDGGSSQGQPLHVLTGGAYQAVKVTVIAGFGTGYGNSPLITVSPAIPAGVAFKVVYYTRQSPASQPEDLVVDSRTFDGSWEADIWAYARNIFETNQTFNGVITFANTVLFSGPVSFPFGLQAPVVINGLDPFIALTINAVGSGEGLLLTSGAGALDADAYLLHIPDDTLSSALNVTPSIFAYGRSNTGAGDAAVGVYGIGGIASGGGLSAPGVIGISPGGDSTGVVGVSGGLNGTGVEGRAALYGVKGELLAPGTGNAGVYGFLDQVDGWGVYGQSFNASLAAGGVRGDSAGGPGVYGNSALSVGVVGISFASVGGSFTGVTYGASAVASGVSGVGLYGVGGFAGFGVRGLGNAGGGWGVAGEASANFYAGVLGSGTGNAVGVQGTSAGAPGVRGGSSSNFGVEGIGGINFAGVHGLGGSTGLLAHGVVGTAGPAVGNLGAGVVGVGGANGVGAGVSGTASPGGGHGVIGQGSVEGSGVFGVGGASGGAGGTFIGGGTSPSGAGIVAFGSLTGTAAAGGLFFGTGSGSGTISAGGAPGGTSEGGDGVVGYAGQIGLSVGRSGLVGYGKTLGGLRGRYGVLGIVTDGTSTKTTGQEPAGVRGSVSPPGASDGVITTIRNLFGGVFSGTGASGSNDDATAMTTRGGYGAKITGSRSKACLHLLPREFVPLTGRVGDVIFIQTFGLVVCTSVDGGTGRANWKGISLTQQVDVVGILQNVYSSAGISQYRDQNEDGSEDFEQP